MLNVLLLPWNVVEELPGIATMAPSGERYAGPAPLMANERLVFAVQSMTLAWAPLVVSQTAPAGDGVPAITQFVPPMVNLRTAVAGSTT
jgi:hypothetical protein